MRTILLIAAILVSIALLGMPTIAAQITSDNAGELANIIKYANTTYTIGASDGKITITNTDANNTLLVVFNPALGIVIQGIEGAGAAIVNSTDYTIAVDIGMATDVGFYGGEMPGHAVALYVGAGSSFNITKIEYDVPEPNPTVAGLSAPSPPSGYVSAGSKSGASAQSWFYKNEKQDLWVAFYEGEPAPAAWLWVHSYGASKGTYMWGKKGAWETKELLGYTGNIKFSVGVSGTLSRQWSVVWAVKDNSGSGNDPTTTTTALPPPSAEFPDDKTLRYALLGAGAFIFILILAMITRR